MAKTRESIRSEIRNTIDNYGSDVLDIHEGKIVCKVCKIELKVRKTQAIDKHCNSKTHKDIVERKVNREMPSNTSKARDIRSTFYYDLCQMMARANIPFKKLNNIHFREFLKKYTTHHIPNESTLRKNYLPQCYQDEMNNITECGSNTDMSEDRDEPSQGISGNVGTLQEAFDALKEISNLNKDSNQFHTFAHHVAVQLEQLPLESALVLQSDIQNLITRTRLKVLKEQKSPETADFVEENSLTIEQIVVTPEIF